LLRKEPVAESEDTLHIRIAQHLFGWEWREDWQAWCPPGWPPISHINAPYLDKLQALERHGDQRYGHSGNINARGRPVIPHYQYDPEATEILWQWLHAQPDITHVSLAPRPIQPDALKGVWPWLCEIVLTSGQTSSAEGNTHKEALCRAVLALATRPAWALVTPS
jgi:hypothetical protein